MREDTAKMKPIRDYLTEPELAAHIQRSLDEDLGRGPGSGDHSSAASLDPELQGIATLRAKESLVFAGCEVAEHVLRAVDPNLRADWAHRDGEHLVASAQVRLGDGRRGDRPPLLCLPGLTRNARDFAHLAERVAGEWRVLCPDLRGRGARAQPSCLI